MVIKDRGVVSKGELFKDFNQYENISSHAEMYNALMSLARKQKIFLVHKGDNMDLIYSRELYTEKMIGSLQ